ARHEPLDVGRNRLTLRASVFAPPEGDLPARRSRGTAQAKQQPSSLLEFARGPKAFRERHDASSLERGKCRHPCVTSRAQADQPRPWIAGDEAMASQRPDET